MQTFIFTVCFGSDACKQYMQKSNFTFTLYCKSIVHAKIYFYFHIFNRCSELMYARVYFYGTPQFQVHLHHQLHKGAAVGPGKHESDFFLEI